MPSSQSTTSEVARVLRLHAFNFDTEDELQRGVAEALTLAGAPFTREVILDARSRIDFMVHAREAIGIEVKIGGAPMEVISQMLRYLSSEQVDGLVLVTTMRRHVQFVKSAPPKVIGVNHPRGKDVEVVWLGFSSL